MYFHLAKVFLLCFLLLCSGCGSHSSGSADGFLLSQASIGGDNLVGAGGVVGPGTGDPVSFAPVGSPEANPSAPLAFIYVANPSPNGGDGGVTSFAVEQDGQLRSLETLGVGRNFSVDPTPDFGFLYTVSFFTSEISQFAIDRTTGLLTSIGSGLTSSEIHPQLIALHPSGNFAYVFHSELNYVTSYLVATNGQLSPNPASPPITAESRSQRPVFNLSGDRMYEINATANSITIFTVDLVTGVLGYLNPSAPHMATLLGDKPETALLSSNGNFLYVANNGGDTVSTYTIGPTGDLTLFQNTTSPSPGALTLHPTLPVLYVGSTADGSISSFTTGADGSLTPLGSPISVPNGIKNILIDPTARFAYMLFSSGDMTGYDIDSTGQLTLLPGVSASGLRFPFEAVLVPAL